MCTELPECTGCEQICQEVDGHTVCSFISNKRSCVFPTKDAVSNRKRGGRGRHCGKGSELSKRQRQMICVLVSRADLAKVRYGRHLKQGDDVIVKNTTIYTNLFYSGSGNVHTRNQNGCVRREIVSCPTGLPTCQHTNVTNHAFQKRESINCKSHNRNLLMKTASCGKLNMFDKMLLLGAMIAGTRNVYHSACKGGWISIVKRLVLLGLDVERKGSPPVILSAAQYGNVELVKYLLGLGCNPDAVDRNKQNILHCACSRKSADMVVFIITKNICSIDLDTKDIYGMTPTFIVLYGGVVKIMRFLAVHGFNMTVRNNNQRTLLHYAAIYSSVDMVKYLVSLGLFRLDSKDKHGQTPLMLAKEYEERDIVEYLKNITAS